jgi:hypothetical protein
VGVITREDQWLMIMQDIADQIKIINQNGYHLNNLNLIFTGGVFIL